MEAYWWLAFWCAGSLCCESRWGGFFARRIVQRVRMGVEATMGVERRYEVGLQIGFVRS